MSPQLWNQAASLVLKGGWPVPEERHYERFSLASWLQLSSRPLSQLSFGRVLHVVHHLIRTKSVLGKRRGLLVPYPLSEEFEKQQNAKSLLPTGLRMGEEYVASWARFDECLKRLLQENSGTLAASALKRAFRTRFHLELSETALGHASMTSLLKDARFTAVFQKNPTNDDIQLLLDATAGVALG